MVIPSRTSTSIGRADDLVLRPAVRTTTTPSWRPTAARSRLLEHEVLLGLVPVVEVDGGGTVGVRRRAVGALRRVAGDDHLEAVEGGARRSRS